MKRKLSEAKFQGQSSATCSASKPKRSLSSHLWLKRQDKDPYVQKAKQAGYRSRSAYKLLEIQEKYSILRPRQIILDLGAAPGGWSQVVLERGQKVRLKNKEGALEGQPATLSRLVGVDLQPIVPLEGAEFLQMDFLAEDSVTRLKVLLSTGIDGLLSDMAPNTTGHRQMDHMRILILAEAAAEIAQSLLRPGGFFLTKIFQGGAEKKLLENLKHHFTSVLHIKPPSSRPDSSELYLLARGFKGRASL